MSNAIERIFADSSDLEHYIDGVAHSSPGITVESARDVERLARADQTRLIATYLETDASKLVYSDETRTALQANAVSLRRHARELGRSS